MRFSTQISALVAALCLSAPALASIVNAAPIPAPESFRAAIEARDPSWFSSIADTFEDVSKAGNAVSDVVNTGDSIVNAGENFFNDMFHKSSSSAPPAPAPTAPTH
jgi:hypothetical protein